MGRGQARSEGAGRGVEALVAGRGSGQGGREAGPSIPPTEQGSHRGVARHAIIVDLHLDHRPLLAPEQIYRYNQYSLIESQRHTLSS